jgi:hypothetical protein
MDNVTINITEAPINVTVNVEEAALSNLAVLHSLATAANDFLVASGVGVFVKKTLAEVKTILGLTDPFQTPVFANPLNLDATSHKDFKCGIITGNTTINLNNTSDGDAGMIILIIDGIGGYAVLPGVAFTVKLGTTSIVTTLNTKNVISWRKVGSDIYYTIIQAV